ncbi:pyrimidine 5'-nucleotidase [Phenylobacterium sp.]|uniref:pyrimidine 5'-nucleotidase n=1 Tax=Phenylobacterium sp. TaxID=1871053 RepID=UPI0008D38535|nr:pyrimidine 5'-nucleotidase [Phenylobacterium sp.]MBA4794262.1 pyrimidine 5'-nucleotidase [Phenylobacterium sp.]OHB34463.1 MAG: pyrimidine 5'-nucleotidase [Phenylobacterium sp. RIFCSPHIGHO2_01_FULL_70_10]
MSADLVHIDTWLFDLDNTLYPAESGFMSEIEARMTGFVMRVTGLPRDEAFALQKRYLAEHGLTLRGLMEHHGVDPLEFNALFHDLSLDALAHDAELLAALDRLPGRRLIFTNADDIHAERVLKHLGLDHLFDDVFHIESFGFRPKPDPAAFDAMLEAHGLAPDATAFFEDSERNLAPAAALGMTTVLVGPHAPASSAPFVQHRTEKLAPFLANARLRETR